MYLLTCEVLALIGLGLLYEERKRIKIIINRALSATRAFASRCKQLQQTAQSLTQKIKCQQ